MESIFKCKISFLLIYIIYSNFLQAQYSKIHFLPPTYNQSSALIFSSITISTLETKPFDVQISNADGTYNKIISGLSKSNPITINLPKGGNLDGIFLASESKTNKVLKNESFILSSEKFFFVNQIHSVSNQAEIIASKGSAGMGTEFYSGHLFSKSGSNSSRAHFISVIATEDNTVVSFDNPNIAWEGQSKSFNVTLNKGESYVVAAPFNYINSINTSIDKWNAFNGTHVTSNKPIVMNSGSFLGGNTNAGQQDAGIDQIVPVKQLNSEFILVKGQGNDPEMETALVVATENNTNIYVNGSSSPFVTLNKGQYTLIKGNNFLNNTMHLKMNNPSLVYQNLSGNGAFSGMGMVFVPGLREDASKSVLISGVNSIGQSSLYIIAKKGEKVSINGKVLNLSSIENSGNSNWVSYRISPNELNSNFCLTGSSCANEGSNSSFLIESTGPINAAVSIVSGSVGAAGYFSGFASVSTNAGVSEIGVLEYSLNCEMDTVRLLANGAQKYVWNSPSGNMDLLVRLNDSTYLFDYDQNGNVGPFLYEVEMEASSVFGDKIIEKANLKINVKFNNSCKVCEAPESGAIKGNQTICFGDKPNVIDNQNSGGATIFEWAFSDDKGANWTTISQFDQSTYNPPTELNSTRWYRRRGRRDCSPLAWSNWTNHIIISVNSPIVNSLEAVNGSRCGEGVVEISVNGLGTGTTVDWYSEATGGSVLTGGLATASFTTPSITSTNDYYAEVRNTTTGCVSSNRTLVSGIINKNPEINLGNDTAICADKNITLGVSGTYASYLWNDNSTLSTLTTNQSGNYTLTVTDNKGCMGSDEIKLTVNSLPVIDLGNDTAICVDKNITFGVSGTYASYLWNDNSTLSTLTTYQSGNYTLTVTDNKGCVGSDDINLSINTLPVINLGNDTAICADKNITFGVSGTYASYLWNDNSTLSTLTTNQSGNYTLTVTDNKGCVGSDEIKLTVNSLPVIDLGNDTAICADKNITFGVSGIYASYLWNDNSTLSTLTTYQSGNYTLTVTDNKGCVGSDEIKLTVNSLPVIDLGNDTAICADKNITLGVSGTYASYLWNDNSTLSTLTTNQSGNYTLTVTDNKGCVGSDEIKLTVNSLPVIDLGNDTAICADKNITLGVSGTYASYLWNDNSTLSTLTTNQSGNYTLTVTDNKGCVGSDEINLTVNNLPVIDLGNDTIICKEQTITLNAGDEYIDYLWSNGSSVKTIEVNKVGEYSVKVTDNNGCVGNDELSISIEELDFSIQNEYNICKNDIAILKTDQHKNIEKILWNDTLASATFTTDVSGIHFVKGVSKKGCSVTKNTFINIVDLPSLDIEREINICDEDNYEIKLNLNNYKIKWENGSTQNRMLVKNTKIEYFNLINETPKISCSIADSIKVNFNFSPEKIVMRDEYFCFDNNDTLYLNIPTKAKYYYLNNDNRSILTENIIPITQEGEYLITSFNYENCSIDQTVNIINQCEIKILIPNSFSPNDDGLNDIFKPHIENVNEYEMYIYNRWGDIIFQTNDINVGWDGFYKNNKVQNDVYVYLIRLKGDKNSYLKFEEYKGTITVLK